MRTPIQRTTPALAAMILLIFARIASAGGLQAEVREVLNGADLRETQVAIMAIEVGTARELVALNPDSLMIPASNLKLLTTAAALKVLGPEFMFRTELRMAIVDDHEQGVPGGADTIPASDKDPPTARAGTGSRILLTVHGDGDPGFCDPRLLKEHGLDCEALLGDWVSAVRQRGVQAVDRLVVDDRSFDREFVHPGWPEDQLNNWYCAQVAGLNFNANCLDVYPEPTALGQPPTVMIAPEAPFLGTFTRAVTGKADTFWISRKPQTNNLTFWGSVRNHRTSPTHITIHDPPVFFGRLLADRLGRVGIQVRELVRPEHQDYQPQSELLYKVQTTLPAVLARCNKDSQNLFAEALLKRMGRKITGEPGSWSNGPAAVRMVLRQMVGASAAAAQIDDGSGLSRGNRLTARLMVNLLAAVNQKPDIGPQYMESLSIGGIDGTLRTRFTGALKGRVLGKSGYIRGVSCLSGYIIPAAVHEHPTGDQGNAGAPIVAFSLLFNDIKPPVHTHQIKRLQEDLLRIIAKHAQDPFATPVNPIGS